MWRNGNCFLFFSDNDVVGGYVKDQVMMMAIEENVGHPVQRLEVAFLGIKDSIKTTTELKNVAKALIIIKGGR